MRLNSLRKMVVMGNIELIKRCVELDIDTSILHRCNIEVMGNEYVFVLDKENEPVQPKDYIGLEYDLATQPDVVLIMEPHEDGSMTFITTEHTPRLLGKYEQPPPILGHKYEQPSSIYKKTGEPME